MRLPIVIVADVVQTGLPFVDVVVVADSKSSLDVHVEFVVVVANAVVVCDVVAQWSVVHWKLSVRAASVASAAPVAL